MKWGSTQSHSTELALMTVLHFTESCCWLKKYFWTLLALIKEEWNEPPEGSWCYRLFRAASLFPRFTLCMNSDTSDLMLELACRSRPVTLWGNALHTLHDAFTAFLCLPCSSCSCMQLVLIRRIPLPPFVVSLPMPQWPSCEYSLLQ